MRLFFLSIFIFLAGCAAMDRADLTYLEPLREDASYRYFKFKAFADLVYPLDSESGERTRMEWLETWLDDNGLAGKKYEVVSRVPVVKNKGLFGDTHDVFYEVKVSR